MSGNGNDCDLKRAQRRSEYLRDIPEGSLLGRYLSKIEEHAGDSCDLADVETVKDTSLDGDPFLSIVTRTQGNRIEELQETLVCLAAQTDVDFELMIIGHKIDGDQLDQLLGVISFQPDWLKDRIRLVTASAGTRSHPLNAGFSLARGSYVTILDDDDLVFDNWVDAFHRKVVDSYGSIVFSYVLAQPWMVHEDAAGVRSLRATGSPRPDFCRSYDPIRQLSMNSCPTMGLCFPIFVFQDLGIHFDETLTTTEDWDFLMRAAGVCGVVESLETVAIYRIWENAESSRSLHDEDEWEANRLEIQEKFMRKPLLIPESTARRLVAHAGGVMRPVRATESDMKLYPDDGSGISEALVATPTSFTYRLDGYLNIVSFEGLDKNGGRYIAVRFDPCEEGMITIDSLLVHIELDDGSEYLYKTDDVEHDGIAVTPDSIAFIGYDPWMQVRFRGAVAVRKVTISYQITYGVREDLLLGTRLVVRMKEKIRRVRRRLSR